MKNMIGWTGCGPKEILVTISLFSEEVETISKPHMD